MDTLTLTDVISLAILSVIFYEEIGKLNPSGLVENRIQTSKLNFSNRQWGTPGDIDSS
jgi:hypothetical protein